MFDIVKYLYAKAGSAGTPLGGTFELTPLCNFNCKMCYIHMSKEEMQKCGTMKTAEEWLEMAEQAKGQGMLFCLLTGGEPLLYKDFWKLYNGLVKMGILVSVNTNASLIDDNAVEKFKKYPPQRLNITLYGDNNDTYRNVCGVDNGYEKVVQAIEKLRAADIAVKINNSISPHNYSAVDGIYSFCVTHNCPVQMASYMFPPVRRENKCTERFTPEEAGKCQAKIDMMLHSPEAMADIRNKIKNPPTANNISNKFICRAGRSAFWINWKGEMTPCGMMDAFVQKPFETSFASAWENIKQNIKEADVLEGCSGCENRAICKVCPALARAETGSFNGKPEYLCKMTESWKRELLKC